MFPVFRLPASSSASAFPFVDPSRPQPRPRRRGLSVARRVRTTMLALAVIVLPGCAALTAESGATRSPATTVSGKAGSTAEIHEPRYLRYRPDETGLIAVFDDGRDTYFEFRDPVSRYLTLHDNDGRLLAHVSSGRVAATPGLHTGILLRVGSGASYASPNPRRSRDLEQALPERIDFVEARVQLQSNGTLQAAMEQALVAATGSAQSGGAATAAARQAVRNAARESIEDGRPAVIERGPMGRLAPLSAANLSALQADQGLIRIFFASGSRAIVAPDDGLGVLLRDAPRADRVRITGFTDSQGDRASNLALARSRADAIAQILLRRGVDPMRIELDAVVDYFIAGNESDRGRAMNRRAEVRLLRGGRPLELEALR